MRHGCDGDSRDPLASLWLTHTVASTFVVKSGTKPFLGKHKTELSPWVMQFMIRINLVVWLNV